MWEERNSMYKEYFLRKKDFRKVTHLKQSFKIGKPKSESNIEKRERKWWLVG